MNLIIRLAINHFNCLCSIVYQADPLNIQLVIYTSIPEDKFQLEIDKFCCMLKNYGFDHIVETLSITRG